MDILYFVVLLAFYGLISALAVGCAHLQRRKAAMRPGVGTPTASSAASLG